MPTVKQRNPGGGRLKKPQTPVPDDGEGVLVNFDDEAGLLAAIRRLRGAEIQAARDYQLSLSTKDAALIAQQKKNWLDLLEQLRKVEQSTPGIQQANAETLAVGDVEAEVSRMVTSFRVALESLPRSLPQKLTGQDLAGMEEILKLAVNEALGQLHTEKWKVKE